MITRDDVLTEAFTKCIKELYNRAQPKVSWEDIIEENNKYNMYEEGVPRPYEFYYIPQKLMDEIVSEYVYAYDLDPKLKDTINILIDYLKEPISIGYENNTKKYVIGESIVNHIGEDSFNIVVKYLTDARNFYTWNYDLQKFRFNVYLGPSPSTCKKQVIENWKKYRNKDIIIDDLEYLEYVQDSSL